MRSWVSSGFRQQRPEGCGRAGRLPPKCEESGEGPGGEVGEGVDGEVGRGVVEFVTLDAVGDAARPRAGVARGFNVGGRVADHQSFFRRGAVLAQDGLQAQRVGLLGFETVATVDAAEETIQFQFP